jgi:hypothetical protein
MQEWRVERSGWRDAELSKRHGAWGHDCPMTDVDFLAAEYSHAKVKALVEYKHERAAPQYPSHPSYRALRDLADRAGIPFLVCRYAGDLSWFRARALNQIGMKFLPEQKQMSEVEWVELLYRLRGTVMPKELFDAPF